MAAIVFTQRYRANSVHALRGTDAPFRSRGRTPALPVVTALLVHGVFASTFGLAFGVVFTAQFIGSYYLLQSGVSWALVPFCLAVLPWLTYEFVYRRLHITSISIDLARAILAISVLGYYALRINEHVTPDLGNQVLAVVSVSAVYCSYGFAARLSGVALGIVDAANSQ